MPIARTKKVLDKWSFTRYNIGNKRWREPLAGAGRKARVLPLAGMLPAIFLWGGDGVRELSVFIDESGDFGPYSPRSPYYIVTLVFHDQSVDISPSLRQMQESLRLRGIPDYTVHAGPLIRREDEYRNDSIPHRRGVFNSLFYFVRSFDITYATIAVDKRHLTGDIALPDKLSKQLNTFLLDHMEILIPYDNIIVYYDHGQVELTTILFSAFNKLLPRVTFRKVNPADYKLFQAADMICTLELLALKAATKTLSRSELAFFGSAKELQKSYLRAIQKKRIVP